MELFKGKYYKGLYEQEEQDNVWLKSTIKEKNKNIKGLELQVVELNKANDLKNLINKHYAEEIKRLEKEVEKKEALRRKVAGRVGGLKAKNHRLLHEKTEMRDLINKLLEEIRRNSKERYKPTLKELKEYFKIRY